jgi:L-asparaginase/Glu-tRNA(Gln) amidotransferase subunit D
MNWPKNRRAAAPVPATDIADILAIHTPPLRWRFFQRARHGTDSAFRSLTSLASIKEKNPMPVSASSHFPFLHFNRGDHASTPHELASSPLPSVGASTTPVKPGLLPDHHRWDKLAMRCVPQEYSGKVGILLEERKLKQKLLKLYGLLDGRNDFRTIEDVGKALKDVAIDIGLRINSTPSEDGLREKLVIACGGTIMSEGTNTVYRPTLSANDMAEGADSCTFASLDSSALSLLKELLMVVALRLLLPFFKNIQFVMGSDKAVDMANMLSMAIPDAEMQGRKIGVLCAMRPANHEQADGGRNAANCEAVFNSPAFIQGVFLALADKVFDPLYTKKDDTSDPDTAFKTINKEQLGIIDGDLVTIAYQPRPPKFDLGKATSIPDFHVVDASSSIKAVENSIRDGAKHSNTQILLFRGDGRGTVEPHEKMTLRAAEKQYVHVLRGSKATHGVVRPHDATVDDQEEGFSTLGKLPDESACMMAVLNVAAAKQSKRKLTQQDWDQLYAPYQAEELSGPSPTV